MLTPYPNRDPKVIEIRSLELHVAHGCNFTCVSCSHYSNQGHRGLLSLEDAEQWMKPWSQRLRPVHFRLLGGEPALHPRLGDILLLARRYWPHSKLWLTSNGFLLHRHPELPRILQETQTRLCVSVHDDSDSYNKKFEGVRRLLEDWSARHPFGYEYRDSYQFWTRRYKGFGSSMEPFEDGNPRSSWENCPARYCAQLFNGAVWKCAPLAYLGMQDKKYGLSEKWQPYLSYTGLEAGCTEAELKAFVTEEDNPCCGMCPANPERFKKPDPQIPNAKLQRADPQ
ncbi:radical SAM protein [Corallococcus sp. 4LFB]|uniref:radical SAM protein n=1 Tax=Corallococcus sp. 4LFB TaxID=3383249 RepID=UPI0039754C6C